MSFRRPVQLGVLLIALVVSVSMALAQEQGQQGPTKQPMGNGMSNEQMQMMHHWYRKLPIYSVAILRK